ncbi:MAG: M20 family metallopeptidase [Pyrinomonadaceae bacterium MAG19_C2-C3]|nr:M20 family metallopeptidase [Pyrinomonadaceae bacterium MAG19_C2-C3]
MHKIPDINLEAHHIAALKTYFTERHASLLTLIRALVEIESPSGDAEASHKLALFLSHAAREIDADVKVELIEIPHVGTHLCLRFFDDGANNKATLLLGHTDTVHPRGTLDARPVRETAGKLYAPGVFDMKANCALALEAIQALVELNIKPPRSVNVLLTCDEETGSATGRALVEREAARAAQVLVLEPSANGKVKTARKGTGTWTVRAEGIAAHAGLNPQAGASAILEIARQIERLHQINHASPHDTSQKKLSGIHLNAGTVSGGTRSNVIAASAETEVDARFATMDEARQVENIFASLKPFDERVKLSIEGSINRPPLERTKDVVLLYQHARRFASGIGFTLDETSVGGASDGNFVSAMNVPVLDGLGINGDGAHAAHEHIVLDDITPRATLVASLIATL